MYCPKCGKENEKDSEFCKACGTELKADGEVVANTDTIDSDIKEPKVNSILALVFSIILAPIGLILSIVGLVRCNKYKKETGKSPTYLVFNIVGMIISIVEIFILFIIGIVYLSFSMQDNNFKGTWNCSSGRYPRADIVKFDDNKFEWFMNGTKNNGISGDYKIVKRKYTNGKSIYNIALNVKSTVTNGKKSNYFQTTTIQMKFDKDNAVIGSYVCTRAY